MKEIKLTKNKVALVDDEDYDWLNQFKWHAFRPKNVYYAQNRINYKNFKMHRSILGITDPKIQIDHIDGDGLNNQKYNLRIASHSQNQANSGKRKNCSSLYKGVSWLNRDKKWVSQIGVSRKVVYLGLFDSEIDAALAYDSAAKEFYGDFAKLNFL